MDVSAQEGLYFPHRAESFGAQGLTTVGKGLDEGPDSAKALGPSSIKILRRPVWSGLVSSGEEIPVLEDSRTWLAGKKKETCGPVLKLAEL